MSIIKTLFLISIAIGPQSITAFTPIYSVTTPPPQTLSSTSCYTNEKQSTVLHATSNDDETTFASKSRRNMLRKMTSSTLLGLGFTATSLASSPSMAMAADQKEPTIWKSGKTPIVPGQKPKDKNDTSGTRKDGNFLRSISNCKSQCENSNAPDGFARSKEECLSDCQDICCTTYEQCTFGIVPRI